jgi:hypothetical protein
MPTLARPTEVMLSTQLEILIALIGLLAAVVLATLAATGLPGPLLARRCSGGGADGRKSGRSGFEDTEPSVLSITRPGPDLADSWR